MTLVWEYRLPGTARMTPEVAFARSALPEERRNAGSQRLATRSRLVQRLEFFPRGRIGRLFWWAELPAHKVIMRVMVTSLAQEAERRSARAVCIKKEPT